MPLPTPAPTTDEAAPPGPEPREIRVATFNACNLAAPGMRTYANLAPYTEAEYAAKTAWMAQQIDDLDADVIGFQEIFSQAALRDVLTQSRNYRHATLAGFDPDPQAAQLTPSVALVSRLPLTAIQHHVDFPRRLAIDLPGDAGVMRRFSRPVLQVRAACSPTLQINVLVLHFKSKRADFLPGECEDDPDHVGIASLRSLCRRGADALGVRYLLNDCANNNHGPLLVMGDFNDVIDAASTQIVLGGGHGGKIGFSGNLFDCNRIQSLRKTDDDAAYSIIYEEHRQTIDHILVSAQLNPACADALGEVLEVRYVNEHLAANRPECSDHGQVLARILIY